MSMLHRLAALLPKAPPPFSGLTFKGRGAVGIIGTASITASYGTVFEGAAPVAGDVAIWQCLGISTTTITDMAALGWAQTIINVSGSQYALQGKVLVAGDISSPPTLCSASNGISWVVAGWAAFTVSGAAPTIAVGGVSYAYSGNAVPANRSVDSSALNPPAVAITCALGGGTDGAISFGGITMDKTQLLTNSPGSFDSLFGHKLDEGGASYTISKADDGDNNGLGAGYISAS